MAPTPGRRIVFPGLLSYPGPGVYPGSYQGVIAGTANITATVDTVNLPPRVLVSVQSLNATSVTILRHNNDGSVYPVRTGLPGDALTLIGGAGVVYDYEAPYNTNVFYTASAATGGASNPITGTTQAVSLYASRPWLINPAAPDFSIPLVVKVHDDMAYASSVTNLPILGRSTPVPDSDGVRKAPTFTMTVVTYDQNDRADLQTILADQSTLLLQCVWPSQTTDSEYMWIQVGDLQGVRRSSTNPGDTARYWSYTCTQVARPTGSVLAQWTYAMLSAAYVGKTYGDVANDYATYRGLTLNQPGT